MRLARDGRVAGVCVVMAGHAWAANAVRKRHTSDLAAFDAGPGGPLACIEGGRVSVERSPSMRPAAPALGIDLIASDSLVWPRVQIVLNHAGATDGWWTC